PSFWYRHPSAKSYAGFLRMTANSARSIDPGAKILLGGLFPRPNRPGAIPLERYLTDLYAVPGVKALFDGVAVHPYARNVDDVTGTVRSVRRIMADNGDAATNLWITELGWADG